MASYSAFLDSPTQMGSLFLPGNGPHFINPLSSGCGRKTRVVSRFFSSLTKPSNRIKGKMYSRRWADPKIMVYLLFWFPPWRLLSCQLKPFSYFPLRKIILLTYSKHNRIKVKVHLSVAAWQTSLKSKTREKRIGMAPRKSARYSSDEQECTTAAFLCRHCSYVFVRIAFQVRARCSRCGKPTNLCVMRPDRAYFSP